MPIGMEVGLGPGDFVVDGDPAPPQKKSQPPPNFGTCLLWPNGWMDHDATWYGDKHRLGDVVLDGVAVPLKEAQP